MAASGRASEVMVGQGEPLRPLNPVVRATEDFPTEATRRDPVILARVRRELAIAPDLDETRIQVRVDDNRVTLTGTVQSLEERRMASLLAGRVYGVRQVRNFLRVRVGVGELESGLVERVEEALRGSSLDAREVDVNRRGGSIVLRGRVHSATDRIQAEEIATRVHGNVRVINELRVGGELS